MRTRCFWVVVCAVLLLLASSPTPLSSQVGSYSCNPFGNCTFNASCEGAFYSTTGTCSIQCWNTGPGPGQITAAGSCSCGTIISGGGGGGGGCWGEGICCIYPDLCQMV